MKTKKSISSFDLEVQSWLMGFAKDKAIPGLTEEIVENHTYTPDDSRYIHYYYHNTTDPGDEKVMRVIYEALKSVFSKELKRSVKKSAVT